MASSRSATATAVQPIDLLALLYIPLGIYVTTSIAMATDDVHAGRHVSALAVLGPAVGRAAVAFLSVIVVAIIIIGLLIIPLVLFSVAALAGGGGGAAIGLIILLIGGAIVFYVLFRWAFAPTAIAIDRAGPVSGLNRSWKLTRGNLWRLGVLVIGIGLLTGPWSIAGSLLLLADKTLAGAVVGVVGHAAVRVAVVDRRDDRVRRRHRSMAGEPGRGRGTRGSRARVVGRRDTERVVRGRPGRADGRRGRAAGRGARHRRRGDTGARRVGRCRRRRCAQPRARRRATARRPVQSPASPAPSAGSTSSACSSSAASC